ncbi:MAG TPA: hypothetical protein VFP61_11760 [Acidimicrobiales bacterium]|nr:hypothetical protein [Acidimicrobiales bacterium]
MIPQDALEAELVGVADLEQRVAHAEAQVTRLAADLHASEADRATLRRHCTDLAAQRDRAEARAEAAAERVRELCGGGAYT